MAVKISVIIPTYAPKDYLWECLDSLENQTLPKEEYEVILVQNGDKEPYETLIKQHLCEYSFTIKTLYSSPNGVSRARNLGMKEAQGSYISFIDDDDWVSANYLEELLKEACHDGIVEANVKDVDEETKVESEHHFLSRAYKRYQSENEASLFANRSFFSSACCKLIPKECIKGQQFDPQIKRGEDSIFMYSISWQIKHVKIAEPTCVYYVRKRHNSAGRRRISFATKIFEFLSQSLKYTCIYLKHIQQNDFKFYLSRIAGTFYNKMILH